jgi:hypothetical protein
MGRKRRDLLREVRTLQEQISQRDDIPRPQTLHEAHNIWWQAVRFLLLRLGGRRAGIGANMEAQL